VLHVASASVERDRGRLVPHGTLEIDFVADQPGLSLVHCHQQIHMDYGFMLLLNST
jgi:FtsP/CotA-like multicopper oxidase with cupredoxin domain